MLMSQAGFMVLTAFGASDATRQIPRQIPHGVVLRGEDVGRFTTLDHPENTLFCRDPFAVARPCVRGTKGSKSSRAGGRPLRDPVVPEGDRHRAGPGCT